MIYIICIIIFALFSILGHSYFLIKKQHKNKKMPNSPIPKTNIYIYGSMRGQKNCFKGKKGNLYKSLDPFLGIQFEKNSKQSTNHTGYVEEAWV